MNESVSDYELLQPMCTIKEEIITSDEEDTNSLPEKRKLENQETLVTSLKEPAVEINTVLPIFHINENIHEDTCSSSEPPNLNIKEEKMIFLNEHSKEMDVSTIIKEEIAETDCEYTDSPPKLPNPNLTERKNDLKLTGMKRRKLKGMKAYELWSILDEDFLTFCQAQGLLAKKVICRCGKEMELKSQNKFSDKIMWCCAHPNGKRVSMTIRKGTFFERSNNTISVILQIVYMWLYSYSTASMVHECDNRYESIKHWCTSCTEVCQAIMESKTDPIGGSIKLVEVFECKVEDKKLSGKRKRVFDSQWVFCGIEQFSSNTVLVAVKNKESKTVLEILKKYILPGTTLFGHSWTAFKLLCYQDFLCLTEEFEIAFYDTVTQTDLNTFEDLKDAAERPMRGNNGAVRFIYNSQFCEYLYRRSLTFANDAFLTFLKDIGEIYVPYDKVL